MLRIWLLAACAQCLLLLILAVVARRALRPRGDANAPLPESLPMVALFIPAAGANAAMPAALRSLLRQDYPRLLPVIITADDADPAAHLARQLQEEFPLLRHVVAGEATLCGQKNHNTLMGIAQVGAEADIYAFCDSTHTARPDFVRQLTRPLVEGQTEFSTGYHRVVAGDNAPVTRAYEISVMLMRLLQAVAVFTQPWGGAMALTRAAYERCGVGALWAENVVDDCSLAGLVLRHKLRVRLCPEALLDTTATAHPMGVWRAWMDRQVLFLKFCVPAQWWLLGLFAALLTLPTLCSVLFMLGGLTGLVPPGGAWLALGGAAHISVLAAIVLRWREFSPRPAPALPWLKAFVLASGMFTRVYLSTVRAHSILWHGILYTVGKGGRVERRQRL